MKPPKAWSCEACGNMTRHCTYRCFLCGSYREAIYLLKENKLSPLQIHEILAELPNYFGLTLHIAKMVIEVYRTSHNEPH